MLGGGSADGQGLYLPPERAGKGARCSGALAAPAPRSTASLEWDKLCCCCSGVCPSPAESTGRCFLPGSAFPEVCASCEPGATARCCGCGSEKFLSPLARCKAGCCLPALLMRQRWARGCQVLPSGMPEQLSRCFQSRGHRTGAQQERSGVVRTALAGVHLQLAACSGNYCNPCQPCSLREWRLPAEMEREVLAALGAGCGRRNPLWPRDISGCAVRCVLKPQGRRAPTPQLGWASRAPRELCHPWEPPARPALVATPARAPGLLQGGKNPLPRQRLPAGRGEVGEELEFSSDLPVTFSPYTYR